MEAFAIALVTDPLRYIAYIFALFGAIGTLLFMAGFGGGIKFIFTYAEDAHHMAHARARIVWGVLICMVTLGLWEIVRVVIGQAPLGYLWLSLFLLTPLWIPALMKLAKGGGGGH